MLVAGLMLARFCMSKKGDQLAKYQIETKNAQKEEDITPQFVMVADDHKDIFGPAKIQPVEDDEIEKQEGKKVRRKKRNLVVRKRKLQSASSSGSPEEEGKD